MEIIFCGNTIPVDHITTNFCTCHYSTAVVSGAKFCRDNFLWTRAEWYFRWNLNCDGKIVSGMDPCSVIKLTFKSEHGWVINSCIELWDVITYPFPILRWTLTLKEAPPPLGHYFGVLLIYTNRLVWIIMLVAHVMSWRQIGIRPSATNIPTRL